MGRRAILGILVAVVLTTIPVSAFNNQFGGLLNNKPFTKEKEAPSSVDKSLLVAVSIQVLQEEGYSINVANEQVGSGYN